METKVDYKTLASLKGLKHPKISASKKGAVVKCEIDPAVAAAAAAKAAQDYKEFVELTNNKNELIHNQSSFVSFEHFEEVFAKWKRQYLHPFRVASSEALREPDGTINQVFKYRYVVYHCAHYGEPRMRGIGKRPNQNYLPCGCRAMLRLNYSFTEKCLKITTLNPIHNDHVVSEYMFNKVSQKARRSLATRRSSIMKGASLSPRSSSGSSRATTRSNTPGMFQPMGISPAQQMLAVYQLQQQQMYQQYLATQKENFMQFAGFPFGAAPLPYMAPPQPEIAAPIEQQSIVEQKPMIYAPIAVRGSAFAPVVPKMEFSPKPEDNSEVSTIIRQIENNLKIEDDSKASLRLQQLNGLIALWNTTM